MEVNNKHKKYRLDNLLVNKKIVRTRSQAESYIRLGKVLIDGKEIRKTGTFVSADSKLELKQEIQYVSRAGMKLESVAEVLDLDFKDKIVLDVGSSTGGFTDFSLRNGAKKVIAVEVGTKQMVFQLAKHKKVELYEKTDIRDFETSYNFGLILVDVSFISLTEVLPKIKQLANLKTNICVMAKPQFEAGFRQTNKGVVKNERERRKILKNLESWFSNHDLKLIKKADSNIAGEKGNLERFYLLRKIK